MGIEQTWDARLMWMLILTDNPAKQKRLEGYLEASRETVVDCFVEGTDWSALPEIAVFRGNKGTPQERLAVLRVEWRKQWGGQYSDGEEEERAHAEKEFYQALSNDQPLPKWVDIALWDEYAEALDEVDRAIAYGGKYGGKAEGWAERVIAKAIERREALAMAKRRGRCLDWTIF